MACQIYSYCISPPAGLALVQVWMYTYSVYVTINVYWPGKKETKIFVCAEKLEIHGF